MPLVGSSGGSDLAATDMSSERFQSSMMSAIMRGMAVHPDVLSEGKLSEGIRQFVPNNPRQSLPEIAR
jgi:hypothetical protein